MIDDFDCESSACATGVHNSKYMVIGKTTILNIWLFMISIARRQVMFVKDRFSTFDDKTLYLEFFLISDTTLSHSTHRPSVRRPTHTHYSCNSLLWHCERHKTFIIMDNRHCPVLWRVQSLPTALPPLLPPVRFLHSTPAA